MGANSLEELSLEQQAAILNRDDIFNVGGSVLLGPGQTSEVPLDPASQGDPGYQVGRGLSKAVIAGTQALGETIDVIGQENLAAALLVTQFSLGGIPKTLVGVVADATLGDFTRSLLEPLKRPISEFVAKYGFNASTRDEIVAVRPASDLPATVAIEFAAGSISGVGSKAAINNVLGAAGKFPAASISIAGSAANARVLARNLRNSGVPRPPLTAAHHIVASGSKNDSAIQAQNRLAEFGIDINAPENGVFLPDVPDSLNPGAYHRSLHTDAYYDNVARELSQASNKQQALDILKDIGQQLSRNEFGY